MQELAQRLASDEEEKPLMVDVRSHGYYDPGALRIEGSVRIEPNNLTEEVKHFSKTKDIFLYCTLRAKRLAPGWRICCGEKDSTRS